MPKLKTHRGAHKRLTVTAKKKVLHSKGNKNHQLTCKEKKRKRQLTKKTVLSATSRRAVKRMLPYEF